MFLIKTLQKRNLNNIRRNFVSYIQWTSFLYKWKKSSRNFLNYNKVYYKMLFLDK